MEKEEQRGRVHKVGAWVKALVAGCASAWTCGCCCACCGKMRGPGVLYDYDDDYASLPEADKRVLNASDMCSAAALALRCVPLCCGCCCGCCGVFGPRAGLAMMANTR